MNFLSGLSSFLWSGPFLAAFLLVGGYYSFFFQGKLIDANMIEIGDVNIKINDYIPNDIGIGDFVSFECSRVDWCFQ